MKKMTLLPLLFIYLFCSAQGDNDEVVHWNKRNKLTWNDYKGSIDEASDAAASTSTYLGIEYNFSRAGLTYKITCSFSKNRSWGRHKSDYILSHEQGHFDIAEIFARKLNSKMSSYKFNAHTYQTDLRKIYQDITEEKDKFQDMYDKETNHSINTAKQEEWLKKIKTMLEELKDYAKY